MIASLFVSIFFSVFIVEFMGFICLHFFMLQGTPVGPFALAMAERSAKPKSHQSLVVWKI